MRGRRAATALGLVAAALLAEPAAAQSSKHKRKPPPRAPVPAAADVAAQPPPPAGPSRIPVTVIEVAGTQAYLQPGSRGGVHRGAKVVLNRAEYEVVETTASYAVIDVVRDPPREQDRGFATAVAEEEEKARELPKPHPLATWERAWTPAVPLAREQTPRFVPLGTQEGDRRWDVRLSITGSASLPIGRGASTIREEVSARVHAEPFAAPLSFDLDALVQRYGGSDINTRAGADARPLLFVRELLLGYGAGGWYAGLGRMRYAASTLGALDGARARAPIAEGLSLGAFGGVLPNPLSGEPSLVAQRFGVEATFNRPDLPLRPSAALVAHGSTFGGALDERRLSGVFDLYPGESRFGGHFEVSGFDANNPWRASPVELTAIGLDASFRVGIFQIGARIDARQPDRSRWLASFLPPEWFCTTVPTMTGSTTTGPEPCDGGVSTRTLSALDANVQLGALSLTVGATNLHDLTQPTTAPDMNGVFASGRVVRIAQTGRFDMSASYALGGFVQMFTGTAGPGVMLMGGALDVSAYYRNATIAYQLNAAIVMQNGLGGTLTLFPTSSLLFTVQAEGIAGDDANAVLLFGSAIWHPRF